MGGGSVTPELWFLSGRMCAEEHQFEGIRIFDKIVEAVETNTWGF